MSLYQILLEQSSKLTNNKKIKQQNVTDYLKSNKKKYPFVNFTPSRAPHKKNKDEDSFTYIRNEIGHCEETEDLITYANIGSQITNQLIKQMLVVLNDIIILL